MYEEQINKIVDAMTADRADLVTFLAGELFLKNNQVDEKAKQEFQNTTGFKVVTGKIMGMLGGYILASENKWYFA